MCSLGQKKKKDESVTETLVILLGLISLPLDIHSIHHFELYTSDNDCNVLLQCHVFYIHPLLPHQVGGRRFSKAFNFLWELNKLD